MNQHDTICNLVGRVNDQCGCYPECRIDCTDREKCLNQMPEYQTKLDKAKRYAAASQPHHPYDTFTARYTHNARDESAGQRMWSVPTMPLLPIGGFSYTEDHHKIGGIDKRFHGVFWDADLYQHMYQLGGRTTLLSDHTCDEQNGSHMLYGQNEIEDGRTLRQLWLPPVHPEMKRADVRQPWGEY